MKRPRSFKLLSKTTFIYLIFTFIAFYSSALFLTKEADEFIDHDLEISYGYMERRVTRQINSGKSLEEISKRAETIKLPAAPLPGQYPVYQDTLIADEESGELLPYRSKTTVISVDSSYYQVQILKSVDDFYSLRDDIFEALIPAFLLLALGIVLFNVLVGGYLFRPFNAILTAMKNYQIGLGVKAEKISTSTTEFNRMQNLFHQMVERIELDYRHLKEYTENMAHEIQTPLAVIRNKAEILMADENVMTHQAGNIKVIYDEGNQLSRLSDTLNLLTKIENSEFQDQQLIITRPIVEKHVAAIQELAELKSFKISTDLSDAHKLLIDPFLFDIVLKNLLRNALRYGTNEGPISIKTDEQHLAISNFGAPLKVPFEKLLERFYHNGNGNASLGLGLSLVKEICDKHRLILDYQYQDGQHVIGIRSGK